MPIKDRSKYPKEWPQIRQRILERANHCCEECKVKNYAVGYRAANGDFYDWEYIVDALEIHGHDLFDDVLSNCYDKKGNPTKAIKIVLTVAHLNNDTNDNRDENLKALCQYHHLKLDLPLHQENSRKTIEKKKHLQRLF